jgi:hypothetical protein
VTVEIDAAVGSSGGVYLMPAPVSMMTTRASAVTWPCVLSDAEGGDQRRPSGEVQMPFERASSR